MMNFDEMTDGEFANRLFDDVEDEPQFVPHKISIREMMLLTFLCAVAIALVSTLNILGTLILFGLALAATYLLARTFELEIGGLVVEALWGCILPVACLATDPFVFDTAVDSTGGRPFFSSFSHFGFAYTCGIYTLLGWQILSLGASWFFAGVSPNVRAWFSGTFAVGAIFSCALGLSLLPLSLFGLVVVVGVLGFTPLISSYVYGQRCYRYWMASLSSSRQIQFAIAGVAAAVIIPATTVYILATVL